VELAARSQILGRDEREIETMGEIQGKVHKRASLRFGKKSLAKLAESGRKRSAQLWGRDRCSGFRKKDYEVSDKDFYGGA